MTTDTDALTERIARALDPDARVLTMDHPYLWEAAMADAARILPIVAEEVRKAQADAWDGCERSLYRWFNDPYAGDEPPRNPHRAARRDEEKR